MVLVLLLFLCTLESVLWSCPEPLVRVCLICALYSESHFFLMFRIFSFARDYIYHHRCGFFRRILCKCAGSHFAILGLFVIVFTVTLASNIILIFYITLTPKTKFLAAIFSLLVIRILTIIFTVAFDV